MEGVRPEYSRWCHLDYFSMKFCDFEPLIYMQHVYQYNSNEIQSFR